MNEQIRFFGLTVLKTNLYLFIRFLEESEDAKKSFRNYLTFIRNELENHLYHHEININLGSNKKERKNGGKLKFLMKKIISVQYLKYVCKL